LKVEKIAPNKTGASRTVAEGKEDVDLGAAAAKVSKADKPHADPPGGLAVVLFAKLDKDSAKKAEDAVETVKGVDKAGTKADAEKGEVIVKLTGSDKVTINDLVKALDGAGVKASTTKG
jgi:hypothetical protein